MEDERKDEILPGFALSDFLQSDATRGWNPETRRHYQNCLRELLAYAGQHGPVTAAMLTRWQQHLRRSYTVSSVNVSIAAANQYFRWCGRADLLQKHGRDAARQQSQPLTRAEYIRLLRAARRQGKQRSYLLVKLFATTDLPVQCLDQVTAELVRQGRGMLHYRGSPLEFRCSPGLQQELLGYMAANGIVQGPVFLSRSGQAMDRVNIFRAIQELCRDAHVPAGKASPRSLRALYKEAQTQIEARLAVLKRQMYDQMLETEQQTIGWPPDVPAGQGRPA